MTTCQIKLGDVTMKNYTLVHEEECFRTPRLSAVKVTYASEDGEQINHTIIRSRPSVAIIVFNENDEIALIRQFRTTTGKWYYELPAGLIEDGESLLQAAEREVTEETGLVVEGLRSVSFGPNLLDPSKSDEDFGVAVGHVAGHIERHLDEQEVIEKEITWMPRHDVFFRLKQQMAYGKPFNDGLFMSGHSVYALLAYKFTPHYPEYLLSI